MTGALKGSAICIVALAMQGCGWKSLNQVHIDPLQTRFPVSASGHYLEATGTTVSPQQYAVIKSFHFDRRVDAPAHATVAIPLQLEEELERLVLSAGGDAVTNVVIQARSYDPEGHYSVNRWKMLGWFGLVGGGSALGLSAFADYVDLKMFNEREIYPWYGVGVGTIALGVVSLVVASSRQKTVTNHWEISVEGQVVKRISATPPTMVAPLPTNAPPPVWGNPNVPPATNVPATTAPRSAIPSATPEHSP